MQIAYRAIRSFFFFKHVRGNSLYSYRFSSNIHVGFLLTRMSTDNYLFKYDLQTLFHLCSTFVPLEWVRHQCQYLVIRNKTAGESLFLVRGDNARVTILLCSLSF